MLGDPLAREGATIIPIVRSGFAVGAGGGIKPLGAIINDTEGARTEGMQSATPEIARTLGGAATRPIETAVEAARGGPGAGAGVARDLAGRALDLGVLEGAYPGLRAAMTGAGRERDGPCPTRRTF